MSYIKPEIKKPSFAQRFPEKMAFWDYAKNVNIDPSNLHLLSNAAIHFKCDQNHEFSLITITASKRSKEDLCKECFKVKIKKNNFLEKNPEKSKFWNYEKNFPFRPEHFTAGSNHKAHFTCEKGHENHTVLSSISKGSWCAYCNERCPRPSATYNFAKSMPKRAKFWNYQKNNGKKPEDFSPGSTEKADFICKEGHEFNMFIKNITKGHWCVYCAGQRATKEINFLKANPEKAKFWDYQNNNGKNPEDFTPLSSYKAHFICECGNKFCNKLSTIAAGVWCQACSDNRYGFQTKKEGYLYFHLSLRNRIFKIGITHNNKKRFSDIKRENKSRRFKNYFVSIAMDGQFIYDLEKEIKASLPKLKTFKSDGYTEMYNLSEFHILKKICQKHKVWNIKSLELKEFSSMKEFEQFIEKKQRNNNKSNKAA